MGLTSPSTGVLVVPPYRDLASQRIKLSFREYDAKILFFLTYFDRVAALPLNLNMVGQVSTVLEQTLVQQGVIELGIPPNLQQGPSLVDDVKLLNANAYRYFNEHRGGHWALAATQETEEPLGDGEANALVMVLKEVLPCPMPDVPLADILAFKTEHANELRQLHHSISKLALTFRGGLSFDATRRVVERELETLVGSVYAAYSKKKIPFFKVDANISFAVPRLAVAGLADLIGQKFGIEPGIVGMAASAVTFNLGKIPLASEDNKYPKDFSYLIGGMRRGLLAASAGERTFENDFESAALTNNMIGCHYPQTLTPPRAIKNRGVMSNNHIG